MINITAIGYCSFMDYIVCSVYNLTFIDIVQSDNSSIFDVFFFFTSFMFVDSLLFFFFKQKTAYEMRISDWSSDVCSSDLVRVKVSDAPMVFLSLMRQSAAALASRISLSSGRLRTRVSTLGNRFGSQTPISSGTELPCAPFSAM